MKLNFGSKFFAKTANWPKWIPFRADLEAAQKILKDDAEVQKASVAEQKEREKEEVRREMRAEMEEAMAAKDKDKEVKITVVREIILLSGIGSWLLHGCNSKFNHRSAQLKKFSDDVILRALFSWVFECEIVLKSAFLL